MPWIEIVATVFAISRNLLTALKRVELFYANLVENVLWFYIFHEAGLRGAMLVVAWSTLMSFYGIYNWRKKATKEGE